MSDENGWPQCDDLGPTETTEIRNCHLHMHTQVPTMTLNVDYFSDWRRLYRALATFLLYLGKIKAAANGTLKPDVVTFEMMRRSKLVLYGKAQSVLRKILH